MDGYRSISTLKFGRDEKRPVLKLDLLVMKGVQRDYNRIDCVEFLVNSSEDGKPFSVKRSHLERLLYGFDLLAAGLTQIGSDYVVTGSFYDNGKWNDGELFMEFAAGIIPPNVKLAEGQVIPPVINLSGQSIDINEKKDTIVGPKILLAHVPISLVNDIIKSVLSPITADKLTF